MTRLRSIQEGIRTFDKGSTFRQIPGWSFAPVEGSDLLKKSPFYFFQLGTLFGQFAGVARPGAELRHFESATVLLEEACRRFLTNPFVPEGLAASRKAVRELSLLLHKLIQDDPKRTLSADEDDALTLRFRQLETIFEIDLQALDFYYVPSRLAYSTSKLIEYGLTVLPTSVLNALPAEAANDLKESTRCLAFGLPTAVAFHVLRAAESVMIAYFDVLGLTLPEQRTWGRYINALGTVRDLPKRLIARLDKLKDYERDELMHPARFLSLDEAFDLFDYVKSVLVVILRDVVARKAAKAESHEASE